MKMPFSKIALSILGTALVVSGVVYAAMVTTVTNQSISWGTSVWAWWYQAVNDKVNSLNQGGFCTLSEYQLKNNGCPPGSIVNSVNDACGEWTCDGTISTGNSCRYFDGTHVGQPISTKCYDAVLISAYDSCSFWTKIHTDRYSDGSTQNTYSYNDPSCVSGGN